MPRLLLVDPDTRTRDTLAVTLTLHWPNVTVVTAGGGEQALRTFLEQEPDVVILGISLPDVSGFEVLRRIRRTSRAPVILLSDRRDEADQVRGLELGADDYVVRPFSARLLSARVRAVLRRAPPSPGDGGDDLTIGPVALSAGTRRIAVHGRPVYPTPVESRLLHHLAANADRVSPYETLIAHIWGGDSTRTADHLRVVVSRLQAKIEQAGGPRCIENVRGFGYRLVRPPASAQQSESGQGWITEAHFRQAPRIPRTKLRAPAPPPDFIQRPRVYELLAEGRGRRLTIVCAPAGFGKTIALAGWLREDGRPSVWISLDELDSNLVSFTRALVSALGTVVPGAGRQALALAAREEHPSPSQLSALLADDLATAGDDLVIVLDDFHLIREASIHALLLLLIRRLPPNVQLVVAGREEPPLQVDLLRRRGELAEVRVDDLRFNRAEALAFLRRMSDARLDLRRVADVVDRSEGWAVGLRLLSLGRSPPESSRAGPRRAAGEHQVVSDYLFDEVLSRQQPGLRRFLTQLSILDRFCPPLCEAVADDVRPGEARRLLDASLAAGLFLTQLDDERHWYRFHHLFRDMLRRCLEREVGPEGIQALRRRASDWFKGQRLWDEAASQAIDAHDVDRVTALVETCLLAERSIGTGLMLESWIRRLPGRVVDSNAPLSLARCAPLGVRGQVAAVESESRRIEAMLAREPSSVSPALLPIARGQIDVQLAWVLCERGGADHEAHDRARRALDLLPVDQYDFRGIAGSLYANTLHYLGRTDDGLGWIGAELGRGTELHPEYAARLLISQSQIELASGRLPALVQTGRRMAAFGNARHNALMSGWGHFALGCVAYEWNDLRGAREHFEAVLALGGAAQRMCAVNARLGLAQTLIALGQPSEAERLVLAELDQVEETPNAFFVESLRSFLARLALASHNSDLATSWLPDVAATRPGIAGYDIENPLLTRARVLLAGPTDGGLDEASVAADRVIEAAEARHVIGHVVKGLTMRALIEGARGDQRRAARSIARALEIAAPGRYTRAFVDLGLPLTRLLVELATHGALPKEGQWVLDACRAASGAPVAALPGRERAAPKSAVALTWRERDVLELMGAHLTTREIAELLGIDEAAVKRHMTNLYSKHRATGPEDAMSRAYDLGLLRDEDRETPPSV